MSTSLGLRRLYLNEFREYVTKMGGTLPPKISTQPLHPRRMINKSINMSNMIFKYPKSNSKIRTGSVQEQLRKKRRKVYVESFNRKKSINPVYLRELTNNISNPKFKVKQLYYTTYTGPSWTKFKKKNPTGNYAPTITGLPEFINQNYVFIISLPGSTNTIGHAVGAIKHNNFLYVFDPHGMYRKKITNNMTELLRIKLNIPKDHVRIYDDHSPQNRNKKGVCVAITRLFILYMVKILKHNINQNTFNKLVSNHFTNFYNSTTTTYTCAAMYYYVHI